MIDLSKYNLKNIKLFVMDVDGTLTDGKIYCSENGEFVKAFNVKDGYGIAKLLPEYGILPVIITGRKSGIVTYRAGELGITEIYQDVSNKKIVLEKVLEKYKCLTDEVAYIGDDLNDLECINMCGVSACPADADDQIIKNCSYVCERIGGNGAVREFIDILINER